MAAVNERAIVVVPSCESRGVESARGFQTCCKLRLEKIRVNLRASEASCGVAQHDVAEEFCAQPFGRAEQRHHDPAAASA